MIRRMNHLAALRYAALPFHAAPLLLVAIFSVLLGLALHAGLLGLPALLILGSWFFKYAFMLLDHAAEGRPGAPVLTPEAANPLGEMRPLAYALAAGVFYMGTGAIGEFIGPTPLSVIRLLGLVALPAIIATHTITGSFAQALNPFTIAAMIRSLGSGYLLIVCVAIGAGLLGRAIVLDGENLAFILRIALLMLLWLVMFSVLGGVLHARRFEVGFEPEHSPERRTRLDERDRNRERDRFVDQVFAEFRAGGRSNPFASIQQRANQSTSPLAEYAWIHDRVATWPDPRLANRVAQELLPLLLSARRHGDALKLVKARLQADPGFRPLGSEHLLKLAELARDGGDRPLARELLGDFDRHFPDDPMATRAQRLAAELAR
jgi:hypothetical protein